MGKELLTSRESSSVRLCLSFNKTRLPEYHEAFDDSRVTFDGAIGSYKPVVDGTMTRAAEQNGQVPELLPELPEDPSSKLSRRPFWDVMFPKAMDDLKSLRDEPSGLAGTPYGIRAATGWSEIVNSLETARAYYYDYSGLKGFWKKTGRKMADHAGDGKTLLSLLPSSEYTSVIHCVFDIIFDAAKKTAELREEVEQTLRQMREKLSDVERVVALCAGYDDHIIPAAMTVLVSVLQALEDIITYYSAKRGVKMAATAMWQKDEYKRDLSECLAGIESGSRRLIEEANLAHIHVTNAVNIKASEGLERLTELQLGQRSMGEEQARLADTHADMATSGRRIARGQSKLVAALKRETSSNIRNAVANERNAAANMAFAKVSATALTEFTRLTKQFLESQRLNARLMVKNDRLSAALQQERSRSRGRYPSDSPEPTRQDQLLQLLDLADSGEDTDLAKISTSAVLVQRPHQGRAEQLVHNAQFQSWMTEPSSTELLIHGYMKPSRTSVSALSLFSAAIVQSLRQNPHFCTLAFFCGEHNDRDDPLTGGIGLIKSLIVQLLGQYHFHDQGLRSATRGMNLDALGYDVEQLCSLFARLVRRMRDGTTLMCILDGVDVYDNPEYMQDWEVEKVLYHVLSLTRDDAGVRVSVKILLISSTDTSTIWKGFDERDVVSMAGQPKGDKTFDNSRFAAQLEAL
jgi:hypothetical protein